MKNPQNNFTTPEQSKRLLELGVPADSADCYYNPRGLKRFRNEDWEQKSTFFEQIYLGIFPCWSTGRLIEILDICQEYCFQFDGDYDKWIPYNHCTPEDLVKIYSDKRNKLDFSKLEELV